MSRAWADKAPHRTRARTGDSAPGYRQFEQFDDAEIAPRQILASSTRLSR